MSGFLNMIVRSAALLWTFLVTALIGNLIAQGERKASLNFTLFVAVLSWIVCLYALASTFVSALGRTIIMLPLDILLVLFTLIDGIVLGAQIGTVNCGDVKSMEQHGAVFDPIDSHCRQAQAGAVFIWFIWICSCIGLFFSFKESRSPLSGSRV